MNACPGLLGATCQGMRSIQSLKWAGHRNGIVSFSLEERFECLLTVDQNLEFQQNITASGIALIVIVARTNRLKELRAFVPHVLGALAKISPGETVRLGL